MATFTFTLADQANINSSKKRSQRMHEWKSKVAKSMRNSGQAYVSKKGGGEVVAAKICPPGGKRCADKCRFNACDLSLEQKQHIFDEFWKSANYTTQKTYLRGLMKSIPAGVKMKHRYFLIVDGFRTEVCKFTFMDVHQITKHMIDTVQHKMLEGKLCISDGRGKHENHRRVEDAETDMVWNHIFSYDFQPVHYSRKEGLEYCLPPHLNVALMFRDFKLAHPNHPDIESKEWLYRKIFRETGILICPLKSDTCRTCDRLHIQYLAAETEEAKEITTKQQKEHLIRGDAGYESLYHDIELSRNEPDLIVLCADLQKVLFTPTLTHSDMFYSRQLSSYNLCIYDGKNDVGNMFLWNETEGKRGVNEMSSAILHYVRATFQVLEPGRNRRLILWSDRCRGQFNNFHIICLLIFFLKEGYFTEVEQKFLMSGHSFMPCDRLFALIEKRKHSCQALVPDDWEQIILDAQPNKPFRLHHLPTATIMDIKSFEALIPRPATLKVTEVARVLMSRDIHSQILTRASHCHDVWFSHNLLTPGGRGVHRNALNIMNLNFDFVACYDGPLPLSEEKKRNFRAFLEFLLPIHRAYYEALLNI